MKTWIYPNDSTLKNQLILPQQKSYNYLYSASRILLLINPGYEA